MDIDDKKLSWCFEATDGIRMRLSKAGQSLELVDTWAHPCGTSIQSEEEEKLAQEFGGQVGKAAWLGEPVGRVV